MLTKYQPTNYLEKKLKYTPQFEYEPLQLNPAKGMSYDEKAGTSETYNKGSMPLNKYSLKNIAASSNYFSQAA